MIQKLAYSWFIGMLVVVLASCSGTPPDPATVWPKELSLATTDFENTRGVISLAQGTNRVLFTRLGDERQLFEVRDEGTTRSVLCAFTAEAVRAVTEVNGRAYVLAATGGEGFYGVFVEPSIAGQPCERLIDVEGEPSALDFVTIPNGFVIKHPSRLELFDVRTNTRSTLLELAAGRTMPVSYLHATAQDLVYFEQDSNTASAELVAVAFDGSNRRVIQKYGNVTFGTMNSPKITAGGNSVFVILKTEDGDAVAQIRLDEANSTPKTLGLVTGEWGTFNKLCAANDDSVLFKTVKTQGADVEARWLQRGATLFQQVSKQTLPSESFGLPLSRCVLTDKFLWTQDQSGGLRRVQLR
jgi:hypothetical protein